MEELRFKNLYDALISQVYYCNMIETYGTEKVSDETVNFDLLKVIFGGFYLTSIIDDYIEKQEDGSFKSKLVPGFLKSLITLIAKDNGNGYTVGDLSYKDEYTVLEKVRNKLAHGDFIVQDGEIIFEEKGIEGRIRILDFMRFIAYFDRDCTDYTNISSTTKTLFLNYSDVKHIYNESDLDKACDKIYKLEITDSPIFPKTKSLEYCNKVKDFHKRLSGLEVVGGVSPKHIQELFEDIAPTLKQQGMHVTYSIQKISEMEEYPQIKKRYMINKKAYKKLNRSTQITTITNIANRVRKGEYQKFDIQKGIYLNEIVLSKLSRNSNQTITDMITEQPDLAAIFIHHIDSTIITSYLVAFNALYEYGLEKGLTVQGAYNWVSIFEGKSLDFSILELQELEDPNMLIEHTFSKYETDIIDYERKSITRVDNLINKCESNLNNYLENCKNKDEEKIKHLSKSVEEAKKYKLELLIKIKQLKERYKSFDLDKYTRNINIIIHIRNAIAHGNVFIESCCDGMDIQNVEIIFKDYLDGNIAYEKKLKVSQFITMFNLTNLSCIYDFLKYNINNNTTSKAIQKVI